MSALQIKDGISSSEAWIGMNVVAYAWICMYLLELHRLNVGHEDIFMCIIYKDHIILLGKPY
jgi:hypothetical protein